MGYTPPKKKKNLWDQITEGIGTAVRNVAKGADAVIPGDQSSWYKEPAPERQVQRPTQIRIEQPKPQVIASFRNEQPESIASFEKDQTQGLQFDTKDNNSLKLQNALNGGNLQVKQPEVNTQRLTVASAPAKVPNITVPQSAPQPKQKYIGYDMSEKENKKLFGVDVGQYMGDFGQVRKMNVGREAEATKQNLVSTYSGMSNEAKRIYREKVQSMADQGNPAAINTMNALKENNVISGDWSQKLDDATETVFGKGGKAIVSGMQQGVSNVADVSIMEGAVLTDAALGLQGASDEQRARELQEYEKMRNWFKVNKAVNGEFLNNKPDYAPTGDFTRDALDLGGRGLQTGLDATMFLNPASNLLKTPGSVTGRQILGNAGRQAAMYGTLDATATGAQVYGQTGDVGQAVKSGVTAGLVSGVTQGGLETATGFMGRGGAPQVAANRLGYKGIALSETDKMTQFNGRDVISYADAEVPQTRPVNNMNLGTDARARFGTNTVDPAKEISAKYGGKVEDVARNIERYGEDATRIMYARKSDSLPYDPETNTGIKSIDAVVTAELRKQFGGKARVTGAPTKQVITERVDPETGEVFVSIKNEPIEAPRSTKTREQRSNEARSVQVEEGGNLYNIRIKEAGNGKVYFDWEDINGNFYDRVDRDTLVKRWGDLSDDELASKLVYGNGKIVDSSAEIKIPDSLDNTINRINDRQLNKVTVKNAPEKISVKTDTPQDEFTIALNDAIASAGKQIENINAEVRSLGFEPDDIRRKMTAANRGQYQMTPDEMAAANLYTNRLDQARGSLEQSGVKIEGQQEFYTPQVKGESFLPSSREELSDFGYKERRTNAYELDEINYGDNPQIDYIVKAENRDLLVQKATNDAAIIDGRSVSPDGVRQAAADTLELQKKIKDKSNSEGVLTNDTLADLYTIGKNEGYTQVDNNYNPGMIVQEPKAMLEQAGIYKNGFEQFDNSVGYANEFVDVLKQNNVPPNQVAAALEQSIRGRMPDADQSSVSAAVEYAMKAMSRNGVEAVNAANIFERAFKNVAKSELFRVGKTTRFSSTKMNKVVNEQINGRILTDAYQKNAAQQFDRFLSERINASLRGLNIVSALFELGDVANIFAKFGVKDMKNAKFGFGKVDGERFALTRKYGQTNSHFASNDIPDVSKLDTIWANENTNLAKKVYDSYRAVENKFLFFRYIEEIKTEMYFRSAENFYKSPQGGGLQGGALVDKVMEDFHTTMLPHKLATANRIVGKMPSTITQYLNWSLQATKRMGRTISGSDTGGKFANMTRGERVARGIGAEIVPKVAVATLAGVPIMQVLGMRDFTNATSGDFTGIEDEDKNVMDTVVQTLSISPAVGVAGNFYFANRRNQIADERAANGESYGSERRVEDQPLNVAAESAKMLIPFNTQAKKSSQVLEAHNKGYYENRDGRIQAEGPNGAELAMGLVTGKGYTPTMREYQDAPDVVSVIKGKANVGDLITKNQSVANVVQALGGDSTREYNRPLTDDYSDKFKAIEGEARTELLKGGRQYNSYLDNLKRTNEDAYNNYISSMDGNHVNPEYWREITKDPETFQMVKDRKLQLYKDLGTEYDPIYDLPDDQASVVLKYKSAPTGDDMALRNILNKEQWYKDYKDRVTAFYDKKGEQTESDFDSTARVKEWEALDDKLSSFYYDKEAKEAPAWAKDFPLVFQQKAINDKFGFDSPESKTFFKGNADAYQAQKEGYDKAQLEVINAMRVIEGVPPMSWEAYQQATEIADTDTSDDKDWKKYGKGGNGGGNGGGRNSVDAGGASFGQKRAIGLEKIKVNVPKITVKRKGGVPGKVTVKKGGKLL